MGLASLHAVYREKTVQATMTQMIAESQAREAEALMEEVKAYAVQNVALRDLQAALAWTPADKLHSVILGTIEEVRKQKVTFLGGDGGITDPEEVKRVLGEAEARRRKLVLGSRVEAQTGVAPGSSMQVPATAGSSGSFGPTEKVRPTIAETGPLIFRDDGASTITLNIRPPIGPDGKGGFRIYRAEPHSSSLRGTGRSARVTFTCPLCSVDEYPPNTNADTVESHVRSVHLDQLLACPGGSLCIQATQRGSLFSTTNAYSLRKHWKFGCHDHVMAQQGGKEVIMSIPLKKGVEGNEGEVRVTRLSAKRDTEEAPPSSETPAKKRKQ